MCCCFLTCGRKFSNFSDCERSFLGYAVRQSYSRERRRLAIDMQRSIELCKADDSEHITLVISGDGIYDVSGVLFTR